jgi:hypothetical protein
MMRTLVDVIDDPQPLRGFIDITAIEPGTDHLNLMPNGECPGKEIVIGEIKQAFSGKFMKARRL